MNHAELGRSVALRFDSLFSYGKGGRREVGRRDALKFCQKEGERRGEDCYFVWFCFEVFSKSNLSLLGRTCFLLVAVFFAVI